MRKERLKTDVARANKELAYYQEKAELATQINRNEERRAKKMGKQLAETEDKNNDAAGEDGGKVKEKKIKNLKKQMDYLGRKRRDFRQREPILNQLDQMPTADLSEKRQRTE